ncbi:TPA: hypothetical protein ACGQ50_000787 [Enterobacter cloacae]
MKGVSIQQVPMSVADCGPNENSKEEFDRLVALKVKALKETLMQGYIPVMSHDDGRMILKLKRKDIAAPLFLQLHAWKNEEGEWGMSCYPTATQEGEPMLPFDEQMKRVEGMPEFKLIREPAHDMRSLEEDDEGEQDVCDCPPCVMRRKIKLLIDEGDFEALDKVDDFLDKLVAKYLTEENTAPEAPEEPAAPRTLH